QAGGGGGAVGAGLSPGGGALGCLLISHSYAPQVAFWPQAAFVRQTHSIESSCLPGSSSRRGQLGRLDDHVDQGAVAQDGDLQGPPDRLTEHQALQVLGCCDGLSCRVDEDVPRPQPGTSGGPVGYEVGDPQPFSAANPLVQPGGQRRGSADDAEVGPPDPAVLHQG